MGTPKYSLNQGERILYRVTEVSHGLFGTYRDALTVTNFSVILEKYGMFDQFKGIERYDYYYITKAKAENGYSQLELYMNRKKEVFEFQSADETEIRVLVTAINDQMVEGNDNHDYNYYQNLKDADRLATLKAKIKDKDDDDDTWKFAGKTVKNLLKSGDFSMKGVEKAAKKASRQQTRDNIVSGVMGGLLDDLGFKDVQDEFIEVGNEFRESLGLSPKITNAERKEIEELEKKLKYQENRTRLNESYQSSSKMSVKEQMDLLQQMKSLLDAGVLTQEEFDMKKKEILKR